MPRPVREGRKEGRKEGRIERKSEGQIMGVATWAHGQKEGRKEGRTGNLHKLTTTYIKSERPLESRTRPRICT